MIILFVNIFICWNWVVDYHDGVNITLFDICRLTNRICHTNLILIWLTFSSVRSSDIRPKLRPENSAENMRQQQIIIIAIQTGTNKSLLTNCNHKSVPWWWKGLTLSTVCERKEKKTLISKCKQVFHSITMNNRMLSVCEQSIYVIDDFN